MRENKSRPHALWARGVAFFANGAFIRRFLGNRALGHSSIYIISSFIVRFGSFLMVPLFWKKLTPTDYGVIAITEIISVFLGTFLGLALETGITRFYYEWPEADRPRRVGTIWMLAWLSSVVMGAVVIAGGKYVFPVVFPDVPFYPYIFLGLINAVLASFGGIMFTTLRMKQVPVLYSLLSVGTFIMGLAFNVFFIVVLDQKLYGFFISNLIAGLINLLVILVVMLRFARPNVLIDRHILDVLRFSLPMIPANLISSTTAIVDRVLLQRFATLEILGIYAVCLKFASVISSLSGALKMSYVPSITKIVSEKTDDAQARIAGLSYYYLVALILAGLFVSLFIKEFVLCINRPAYFSVINYVPFLVLTTFLAAANIYISPGLFLAKRSDLIWIPIFIQLFATIAGGIIFVPRYGIYGVIAYQCLTAVVYMYAYYYLCRKVYYLPFPWRRLCLILLLSGILILTGNFLPFGPVYNVVAKAVGFFGVALLLLRSGKRK